MKFLFIQTGGTIDKDYPKTTKGYSFEISEPAVKRILDKVNPVFEYEILSVLKLNINLISWVIIREFIVLLIINFNKYYFFFFYLN